MAKSQSSRSRYSVVLRFSTASTEKSLTTGVPMFPEHRRDRILGKNVLNGVVRKRSWKIRRNE